VHRNDRISGFVKGHASRPYNKAGMQLLLIILKISCLYVSVSLTTVVQSVVQ